MDQSGATLPDSLLRLLDAVPDAMAIVDGVADIRFANSAWEVLFGHRHGELVGTRITSLLDEGLALNGPPFFRSEGGSQGDRAEMIGRRKDGAWLPLDVTTMPFDTPSGSVRILAARDLTERWQAEDVLHSAQEWNRKRLSDGIHDDTIQSITAASLRLQQLRRGARGAADLEVLSAIEGLLEMTSIGLRRLMIELHPPSLEGLGLATAIRELLQVMRVDDGVSTQVRNRVRGEPSIPRRITLYRIAEEALRAAAAAGRRGQVVVEIDDQNHGFLLSLQYDGTGEGGEGFARAADCARITVRARSAGGWARFERRLSGGARAAIWIPSDAAASRDEDVTPALRGSAA
jgi:PAS domain S-box-containing protein